MALPTLATIRTGAQIRADHDSSDFPTQAQYNILCSDAAREVWWDLRQAGFPVNFATSTFTANGTTFYPVTGMTPAVTTQVASVHGAYYLLGTDYYPLHRINEGKRAGLRSSSYQPSGFSGFYDVRYDPTLGLGIELLPPPQSGTYVIDYIAEHPGLALDTDTWYGPAGSDVLVSLKAAYFAVKKEGAARMSEAQGLLADYKDLLQSVTSRATWLDMRNPAQVRDINSELGRYSFDYPLAGPDPVGY